MKRERLDPSRPWLQDPSQEFFKVAQELQTLFESQDLEFDFRRKHQRVPRSISVSVQPLDDDFRPDGEACWVVSRDISLKGVGLICYDRIEHTFVKLGLTNENVSVLGHVRHNTSIGQQHPLYLVGVEFLNEMDL